MDNKDTCLLCGKITGRLLRGHVEKEHQMSLQDYYDRFYKKEGEGVCLVCGTTTKFYNAQKGYSRYCSSKCQSNSNETKMKRASTNIERYGVACALANEKVQAKARATCLKNYGVENSLQSKVIQQKRKENCIKKYGVEHIAQLDSVKEKRRKTNIERYGVDNPLKSEEIKEKVKNTNLKKYGTTCVLANEEVKAKAKATCLERYGVENVALSKELTEGKNQRHLEKYGVLFPNQRKEVREKIVQTSMKRYGTENPMQNEVIKDKTKKTNLERYGVTTTLLEENTQKKIKETNLKKYGVENPAKSSIVKQRMRETCVKKYGLPFAGYTEESLQKKAETNLERYGMVHHIAHPNVIAKSRITRELHKQEMLEKGYTQQADLLREYGESWIVLDYPFIEKYGCKFIPNSFISTIIDYTVDNAHRSILEKDICDFIVQHIDSHKTKVICNGRKAISPLELDIYIPDKQLAIECDGIYYHSTNYGTPSDYHVKKTLACMEKGIRLIHINEWEWRNKRSACEAIILSALGVFKERIYARHCTAKEVLPREANDFFSANHFNGYVSATINLGLFYNDELVQAIALGNSRFKKGEVELLRMATKQGVQVVGGFSKLLSRIDYPEIVSYVDISKFTGDSYEKVGFDLIDVTEPSYAYYKDEVRLSRYQAQKHKLPKVLGDEFNPNLTEVDNMLQNGYMQVFDCGNYKLKLTR